MKSNSSSKKSGSSSSSKRKTKAVTKIQTLQRKKRATRKTQTKREAAETCPVCLERIYNNPERLELQCNHALHNNCAEQLKTTGHTRCPECRRHAPELVDYAKYKNYIEYIIEETAIYNIVNTEFAFFAIPNKEEFIEFLLVYYLTKNQDYDENEIEHHIVQYIHNIHTLIAFANSKILQSLETIQRTIYTQSGKGPLKKGNLGVDTISGILIVYKTVIEIMRPLSEVNITLKSPFSADAKNKIYDRAKQLREEGKLKDSRVLQIMGELEERFGL